MSLPAVERTHDLPERSGSIASNLGLRIGHATHRGVVREVNEDSYLVLTKPAIAPELTALLAVADGMGGHNAGDVASSEVVRCLNELFSSSVYQQRVAYNPQREDYYIVVLKEVLEQINERVFALAGTRSDLQGMGSTGSLALLASQRLYVGHVGDSRIYRLRGGEFQRLTQDHTWVAEQVAAGQMTAEQAAIHPKRNRLTRCLGYGPVLRVDRAALDLQVGDVLLLCSDGLTGVVGDGELAQAMASGLAPQAMCDRLVEMANQRGGPDNITVLIAQVLGAEGSDLPGGRAFGPHAQEAVAEQVDTVKIQRPKPQPAAPALRRPVRQRSAGPGWLRPLALATLGLLAALACAGVDLLLVLMVKGWLGGTDYEQAAAVFVAAIVGVAVGLLLAEGLSPRSGRPPKRTEKP